MIDADIVVVGGGIVGLSTAMQLTERFPGLEVLVLEKEAALATHQTGHNSGVIHAGVYYQPGSLKARFCREGVAATIAFCREHGLPFEQCGKLLVATDAAELERMDALLARSRDNGLALERLDAAELRRREPNIAGVGALFVPSTGIVDYAQVARKMAEVVQARGGRIRLSAPVTAMREDANGVTVEAGGGTVRARRAVVCGGLMADRLARMCGVDLDFRIVPFRGEYYRLPPARNDVVSHLIYPIPDPALPFLGVHLTRMIGGYVTVGPNAVLAFAREGYRFADVSPRDVAEMVAYSGFRRVIRAHLASGLSEMANSLSKRRYLALCRRYCPSLTVEELLPHPAGVRAQAVMADGTLVHDFLVRQTARTVHVCNAPSPAATSSIPIGRHVADQVADSFGLKAA